MFWIITAIIVVILFLLRYIDYWINYLPIWAQRPAFHLVKKGLLYKARKMSPLVAYPFSMFVELNMTQAFEQGGMEKARKALEDYSKELPDKLSNFVEELARIGRKNRRAAAYWALMRKALVSVAPVHMNPAEAAAEANRDIDEEYEDRRVKRLVKDQIDPEEDEVQPPSHISIDAMREALKELGDEEELKVVTCDKDVYTLVEEEVYNQKIRCLMFVRFPWQVLDKSIKGFGFTFEQIVEKQHEKPPSWAFNARQHHALPPEVIKDTRDRMIAKGDLKLEGEIYSNNRTYEDAAEVGTK